MARAPCSAGGGDEAADRVAEPPVPRGGGQPGQVQRHRERHAEDVPVGRDDGDGQVAGVEVDGHDRVRPQFAQRRGRAGGRLPARPGTSGRTPGPADVVADGPGGGLGGDLVAPVGEPDRARQPVPAVRPVRQTGERGGELDLQPALVRVEPDCLVSPRACRPRRRRSGTGARPPTAAATGLRSGRRRPGSGACAAGPARPASPRPGRTPAAAPSGPAGPSAPGGGWSWRAARRGSRTRGPGPAFPPAGTAARAPIRRTRARRLARSARRFRSASCHWSSLARVIAPAHRDDDPAVSARFRSRRDTARPFASSRPSAHRAARSRPGQRPQVRTHRPQHRRVLRRDPQPGTDPRPRRGAGHERRRDLPQPRPPGTP